MGRERNCRRELRYFIDFITVFIPLRGGALIWAGRGRALIRGIAVMNLTIIISIFSVFDTQRNVIEIYIDLSRFLQRVLDFQMGFGLSRTLTIHRRLWCQYRRSSSVVVRISSERRRNIVGYCQTLSECRNNVVLRSSLKKNSFCVVKTLPVYDGLTGFWL